MLINIAFPDFENYTDCLHYWKVYTEVVRHKELQEKKIEREENDTENLAKLLNLRKGYMAVHLFLNIICKFEITSK